MAAFGSIRALHWVFKITERKRTMEFYAKVLKMKVLRHEEFAAGCDAQCNGPYEGKWSKTMVGYGPEDDHFVVELTYNYPVPSYKLGNDFAHLTVKAPGAIQRAHAKGFKVNDAEGVIYAPDGYAFRILDEEPAPVEDPVTELSLNVTDLRKSLDFYGGVLGFSVLRQDNDSASLRCDQSSTSCNLTLLKLAEGETLDHAEAFGRVAFSIKDPKVVQKAVEDANLGSIQTPYISLDTPGKATVQVVIVTDPDGYEICFVGDDGFRELSRVDSAAPELLETAMAQEEKWSSKYPKRQALPVA